MTKRDLVVASTRHHLARLLKYYPRRPCAPSFVKSRILRPLQRHFLLFQQVSFILLCIHTGNPRVPPRVLASAGAMNISHPWNDFFVANLPAWQPTSHHNSNRMNWCAGWFVGYCILSPVLHNNVTEHLAKDSDVVFTCFFFELFRGFVLCCRIPQHFVFTARQVHSLLELRQWNR